MISKLFSEKNSQEYFQIIFQISIPNYKVQKKKLTLFFWNFF